MGDRLDSQWIFSAGELEQTPSVKLGMALSTERSLRQKCILFILELARYLSCNHLVISSAAFMFQRFMMCQAFQNHDRFIVCATCIFLAGKVEEQPKRLKDVVDVYLLIRSKVQSKSVESELKLIQDKILVAERILLQTLGFDLQIDHPYGYCMHLLKSHKASFTSELARGETNEETRKELNDEARKDVKRLAMNFLTDSFRGVLCLEFSAEVIATAVILLAVLSSNLPPPVMAGKGGGGVYRKGPGGVNTITWTELLLSASKGNVSEIDLMTCCSRVIEVYEDKVVAIAGPASDGLAVKENNLLRLNLESESRKHKAWLQQPIAEQEEELKVCPQVPAPVAAVVVPRAPPKPPPRALAAKPLCRAAPPPPPARPAVQRPPIVGSTIAKMAAPSASKGFAPPTPDVLPPPTPENMPPPTPDNLPPPTPEHLPPPTPGEEVSVPMEPSGGSGVTNEKNDPNDADVGERAKKRRAEDRQFSGNVDTQNNVFSNGNNEYNDVRKEGENGNIINGRNDDGTSPPKKYKM